MAGALFFVTVLLLTDVNQQYRSGELPVTVQYTADQSSNILDVNTTLSVAVSLLGEVVAGGVTQNSVTPPATTSPSRLTATDRVGLTTRMLLL